MIRGLYTSALGMTTQMKRMDVVSNNLANADTNGFKKDTVSTKSFADELTKRLDDPKYNFLNMPEKTGNLSLGVYADEVYTDFSQGAVKQTGNKLDCSIGGKGFFSVSVSKNGETSEKYTRDGSFTLTNDRTLTTKQGYPILGEKGQIKVDGEFSVDEKGNVYSDGKFVDKLKLTDFNDYKTLRKYGENLTDVTSDTKKVSFAGSVNQGSLEASNVNVVREMVEMITVSRSYEANQRMIQAADQTLGRAVNDLARKG